MTSITEGDLDGIPSAATVAARRVRPLIWSVRRELWENRWVYFAPLSVAALALLGFLVSMVTLPERRRHTLSLDASRQAHAVGAPYAILAAAVVLTTVVVGVVYCLSALHGERRDRSILFWKSLPVSDLTTVAAKAFIPLAVLPALAVVLTVALQAVVLAVGTAVLAANGLMAMTPGTQVSLAEMAVVVAYRVFAFTLWWAPLYAWLLLVSGWAKRAAFLWAFLPPLVLCLLERIALGSSHLSALLLLRLTGADSEAFRHAPLAPADHAHAGMALIKLSQLTPLRFLSSPDLWLGLAVGAALLCGAVWQRRRREPI